MTLRATPPVALARPPLAAVLRNAAGVSIELLDNGAVHAIRRGDILVNQVLGSPVEGGLGNLYLRRRHRTGAAFVPVLGPGAGGRFAANATSATWEGSFDGVEYRCTLRLHPTEPTWFWTLEAVNRTGRRVSVDAVLAQDLGLASEDVVRSSEAYASQYLDHTVVRADGLGILLCSRQNLPQDGANPWVMHGCLEGATGFLTDGVQLYGLGYRASGVPAALEHLALPNRVYQYELAHATIQSRHLALRPDEAGRITFFATLEVDHPAATGPGDVAYALRAVDAVRSLDALSPMVEAAVGARTASSFADPLLFRSRDPRNDELVAWAGGPWRHEEWRDGRLLSFFRGRGQHVVLRAKELLSERPTGLIMRSGRDLVPSDETLSVTAWMDGCFAAQLAIGNTTFNKLLSVSRHPLNALRSSGQRILVRTTRGDELLGVPSAMEMGPNGARWLYIGDEVTLAISVVTSPDEPSCRLTVDVERGGPVELLITHDIVLAANEHDHTGSVEVEAAAARVELRPSPATLVGGRYPEATFSIVATDPEAIDAIGGDDLVYPDGANRGGTLVVFRTRPVDHVSLVVTGSILDAGEARRLAAAASRTPAPDPSAAADPSALRSMIGGDATLGGADGMRAGDVARLDDLVTWYLHDALIHYTAPHGLEQSSGAAWGLRDICQGPVELLVATGDAAPIREILRVVYAHQDRRTGDWPQWFMFDRFREIQAPGSHADIIDWPIKALCDYVEATGDTAFLGELVPYADDAFEITSDAEPILAHVVRQVDRIEHDCIAGTSLPVFAGGDWEDTLQPVDPAMARQLVSSWTVALEYQSLGRLRVVCERAGHAALATRLGALCERLRADFNEHLVPDGVVAGLAHFAPDGVAYLLHPRDRRTGVHYRLLPMTRGIIAGLFSPEQATRHAALIERHLLFPDGVRLQDRPMTYHGGTSRTFRRAETAACFGREVGLQYVHAHIRYVEAMTVLGRADEAWHGLLVVCPILIESDVPAALPRQSNAYFSSSDADFADRREASRHFDRIRSGQVGIKGGWRVYSSGPGIYLNQLISNVLGLRASFDDRVFDPVLPLAADGLTFERVEDGRRVRYLFRISVAGGSPTDVVVNGVALAGGRYTVNPYRRGGLLVDGAVFRHALDRAENLVEIRA